MSDPPPLTADLPELRLLAQLGGVSPLRLAGACNDPVHFSKHLSADELSRFLSGASRVIGLINRINEIMFADVDRTLEADPELRKRMNAKGLV